MTFTTVGNPDIDVTFAIDVALATGVVFATNDGRALPMRCTSQMSQARPNHSKRMTDRRKGDIDYH